MLNFTKNLAGKFIATITKDNPPGAKTPEAAAVKLGSFTDPRDGKTYKTVKIGSQTWMAENLNYHAEGSKCYDNKPENGEKYGRLYDWSTAMKSCPSGWHLPAKNEWEVLDKAVGGNETAGAKLKAKNGWHGDGNGTDKYGFSALPGGYGYSGGNFSDAGEGGLWWSATEDNSVGAYYLGMYYRGEDAYWDVNYKSNLFSVRCVRD